MKEVRKIKRLKTQIKQKRAQSEAIKIELANVQREYQSALKQIQELEKQVEKVEKSDKLKVSEHAIVRYFERVKGFDIEKIEKEILSEEVLKFVDKLGGNGSYPNADFKVVMKNFTVTTII